MTHGKAKTAASLGTQVRNLLKREDEIIERKRQASETALQRAMRKNVNAFFSKIANDLPKRLKSAVRGLKAGKGPDTDFNFEAESKMDLSGLSQLDLPALPGFKKLDAVSKKLNIDFNVTAGRMIYASNPYLHVRIDSATPYEKGVGKVRAFFGPPR